MRLTVLGSSGTYPATGNPASSYLVSAGGAHVWCDAGPGSFLALRDHIDPSDLEAIVITHEHPDHCLDVLTALHTLTYGPDQVRGLPLLAHASVLRRLEAFLDAGTGHPFFNTFAVTELGAGSSRPLGELTLDAIEMDHSVPTLGFRFASGDRSIFYTGDTGPGGTWIAKVGPVDLMLSEASFQGAPPTDGYTRHLTAGQAGEIAARTGATRLLLTHIPPHLDPMVSVKEAEITFGRTVMVAVPGTIHEV